MATPQEIQNLVRQQALNRRAGNALVNPAVVPPIAVPPFQQQPSTFEMIQNALLPGGQGPQIPATGTLNPTGPRFDAGGLDFLQNLIFGQGGESTLQAAPDIGTTGPRFGGDGSVNPLAALWNLFSGERTIAPGVEIPDAQGAAPQTLTDPTTDPLVLLSSMRGDQATDVPSFSGVDPLQQILPSIGQLPPPGQVAVQTAQTPAEAAARPTDTAEAKTDQAVIDGVIQPTTDAEDAAKQLQDQGMFGNLSQDELSALLLGIGSSLLAGQDFGRSIQSGLAFLGNTRQQRIAGEERAEAKEAAKGAAAREARVAEADIQLKQAQATKALADAEKAVSTAATKDSITDKDFTKLVTDVQGGIEENAILAETPIEDPNFEAVFRVNSLLPEDKRRKAPFTADKQSALQQQILDPNIPETEVVAALEKAQVVYGADVVDAWLNNLGGI